MVAERCGADQVELEVFVGTAAFGCPSPKGRLSWAYPARTCLIYPSSQHCSSRSGHDGRSRGRTAEADCLHKILKFPASHWALALRAFAKEL